MFITDLKVDGFQILMRKNTNIHDNLPRIGSISAFEGNICEIWVRIFGTFLMQTMEKRGLHANSIMPTSITQPGKSILRSAEKLEVSPWFWISLEKTAGSKRMMKTWISLKLECLTLSQHEHSILSEARNCHWLKTIDD